MKGSTWTVQRAVGLLDLYTYIHEIEDYEILALASLCVTLRYVSPKPIDYQALCVQVSVAKNVKRVCLIQN